MVKMLSQIIRGFEVSDNVSIIAQIQQVREKLIAFAARNRKVQKCSDGW